MRKHRPWSVETRDTLFDHPLFRLERHHLRAEDRSQRQALVLDAPHWVNVIALLEKGAEPEVLLVRQWRYAIQSDTLEIPGGMVDPGEGEEEAARRELFEETGYRARTWRRLGEVQPNPAILTNRCGTWLAEDLERVGEAPGDGDEELSLERAPLRTIPELVARGTIRHSLVIAAFYLWNLDGSASGDDR